jgi:hypothetical protein
MSRTIPLSTAVLRRDVLARDARVARVRHGCQTANAPRMDWIARCQCQCGEVSERLKEHAWKVCKRVKPFRGFESRSLRQLIISCRRVYGGLVGPLATIARKLRQVRKEATVASDSGAGVWLARLPPFRFTGRFKRASQAALPGTSAGPAPSMTVHPAAHAMPDGMHARANSTPHRGQHRSETKENG